MTRDIEAELRQLDAERERLQATARARHPDPDGGPEAVAAQPWRNRPANYVLLE